MTFITLQGLQPKSTNKPTLSNYTERTHAKKLGKGKHNKLPQTPEIS
jgi:hypothetical protein